MKYLLATILPLLLLAGAAPAQADLLEQTGLEETGEAAGLDESDTDVYEFIGTAINFVLGFLGVAFLLIVLYAGILWMTAGGDEEKITQARGWLINSVIGIIIIMAAYAISQFVLAQLMSATI
jgi:hypothetical protein